MLSLDKTIGIISNNSQRPDPEIAEQISNKNKISAARAIDLPICSPRTHLEIHKKAMPLLENMLTWLLKETPEDETKYYVFARDGVLAYDALWAILNKENKNISDKLELIKTSLHMYNPDKEYFNQIGINNQNLKNGLRPVFIDSVFQGSMFTKTISWSGIKKKLAEKQIRGYLFARDKPSKYNQIKLSSLVSNSQLNKFNKNLHKIKNFERSNIEDPNTKVGDALCTYMQIMPKATNRYTTTTQNEDGS